MNILLKISPSFIKELDRRLRVNLPWVWATRSHLNLFWGLVLGVLFAMIGLVYQVDQRDVMNSNSLESLFMILCIPAVIWILFSIYQLALFNDEKIFGKHFYGKEILVFVIYFITFSIPFVIPYSTTFVINQKIAGILTNEELDQHYHDFHYGKMYFPVEAYHYEYYDSDMDYINSINNADPKKYVSLVNPNHTNNRKVARKFLEGYHWKYEHHRDSMRLIRDSIFQESPFFKPYKLTLFSYPRRGFETYYDWGEDGFPLYADSSLIDFVHRRNLDRDETIALERIKKLIPLMYDFASDAKEISEQQILEDYRNHRYVSSYSYQHLRSDFYQINQNLSRIARAKMYKSGCFSSIVLIVLPIILFLLTILFSIYKNVNWKELLIGVVTLGILALIAGVIEVVGRWRGDFILSATLIMYFVTIILTFRAKSLRMKNVFVMQSVVVLNLTVVFLPICTLIYLDEVCNIHFRSVLSSILIKAEEWFNWGIYNSGRNYSKNYLLDYSDLNRMLKNSMIFLGIGMYLVFWNSYFKRLYLKLWALPSNK